MTEFRILVLIFSVISLDILHFFPRFPDLPWENKNPGNFIFQRQRLEMEGKQVKIAVKKIELAVKKVRPTGSE